MQLVVYKQDGKFQRSDRDLQMMQFLPDGWYQLTVYTDEVRTLEQNRRYWKMIDLLAEHCGYRKNEMHEVVLTAKGETTSVLNKKRHSELQEYVEAICQELSIELPRDDKCST